MSWGRQDLTELGLAFLVVTATVYLVGFAAWKSFGLAEGAPAELIHSIFDRWDVLNYVLIAEHTYSVSEYHVVWFPAMPAAMRAGAWLGIAPWITGTTIVLTCTALLVWVAYHLFRLDYAPHVARDAVLFMLVFPSSLFLYVPYTEAPLLLSVISALYLARRGHWAFASLIAGAASGIRITGLFIGPALLVEYLSGVHWQIKNLRGDALWLLMTPLGLLVYMAYLDWRFDDPIAFYHRQFDFPRLETVRTEPGVLHFIPSFINEVRVIFITESTSERIQNLGGLAALLFFGLMLVLMLRWRMRPSYLAFTLMAVGSTFFVGRLESINRYVIVGFPMFLVMALAADRSPVTKIPWLAFSLGLLYLSAAQFATYHWAG